MVKQYIYIVTNHNGIGITVVAETIVKARTYVEEAGYTVIDSREIGVAYAHLTLGIID